MCRLCDLVNNKKEVIDNWVVTTCDTCNVPLYVYYKHTMKPNASDLFNLMKHIMSEHGDVVVRTQARSIKNHWHCHVKE